MTYRELQIALKQYRNDGLTKIALNSKKDILQAEYDRIVKSKNNSENNSKNFPKTAELPGIIEHKKQKGTKTMTKLETLNSLGIIIDSKSSDRLIDETLDAYYQGCIDTENSKYNESLEDATDALKANKARLGQAIMARAYGRELHTFQNVPIESIRYAMERTNEAIAHWASIPA